MKTCSNNLPGITTQANNKCTIIIRRSIVICVWILTEIKIPEDYPIIIVIARMRNSALKINPRGIVTKSFTVGYHLA